MSENVNEDEINKLSRMILGTDDTATSEIMGYRFKYHAPSMRDQLQIQTVASNLRIGAIQTDLDFKVYTTIIATFDVLCDEIVKVKDEGRDLNPVEIIMLKDEKNNPVRKIRFWEFIQNKKNPLLYQTLLLPLYNDFMKFQDELAIKYKDLKN